MNYGGDGDQVVTLWNPKWYMYPCFSMYNMPHDIYMSHIGIPRTRLDLVSIAYTCDVSWLLLNSIPGRWARLYSSWGQFLT